MEPIDALTRLPSDLLLRDNPADAIGRLHGGQGGADAERLKDVAKKFEGVFLQQLVKQMKQASAELEDESEDASSEQIKSMYWNFWADAMMEQGGFGMWKQIYKQLSELTGQAPAAAAHRLDESV